MGGAALILISRSNSIGGFTPGLVLIGMFAGFYLPSGIPPDGDHQPRELGKRHGPARARPEPRVHHHAPALGASLEILFLAGGFDVHRRVGDFHARPFLALRPGQAGGGGTSPRLAFVRENPWRAVPAWIMGLYFTLAIGASYGLYTLMPFSW